MSARTNLWIVMFITLIGTIGIALPYPILSPLFLNSESAINQFMGLDPYWLLGIALATYPLGLLIGGEWLGRQSDRLGRKPVLLWSLLASVVAHGLCVWALLEESFVLFALTRLLTGILEGNISVARAIVTDLNDASTKTVAFSYVSSASYAGWFLGPFIGGYSADLGFHAPFVIAALLNLAAFVFVLTSLEESHQPAPASVSTQQVSSPFWRTPYLKTFVAIQFLLLLAVNIYYEFYPVYLVVQWQSSPQTLSHATMIATSAMMLCSLLFIPRWATKISKEILFAGGAILTGFSFIIFTLPTTENATLFTFLLSGFCISLYASISNAWFSDRFPQLQQGRLMGTLVANFCLANIVAALAGSWLASLSITLLLVLAGIAAIVSGLLLIIAFDYQTKQSLTHQTS
ncbi:MFS transporter [Pleionea sp. CnH1-48]|uniref:MFS transporter n=1 Tax=Pleionea sp. CnH1-48 TaxID=2954494 RepID=UPI002097F552|nr:MFS transporter [Pleionea sp. CnH1-48]MCO7223732.1 MFS transporter [Pleionea sp. CnH1-48]